MSCDNEQFSEQGAVIAALKAALESFAKSMQILKQERDEARTQVENQKDRIGELFSALEKLTEERDEAIRQRDETNESSKFSCNFNYEEKLKAERERDEAREQVLELKAYGVEDDQTIDRLIRERDEAREALAEETKFHHRTHSELVQTQCKLMDATEAIIATLEENRHLADGDDCTLAKLKSVVPDWK